MVRRRQSGAPPFGTAERGGLPAHYSKVEALGWVADAGVAHWRGVQAWTGRRERRSTYQSVHWVRSWGSVSLGGCERHVLGR
jgi:hypothetical protein